MFGDLVITCTPAVRPASRWHALCLTPLAVLTGSFSFLFLLLFALGHWLSVELHLGLGCPSNRAPGSLFPQGVGDERRREALTNEVLIQPRAFRGVFHLRPAAQFLLDRFGDERSFVEIAEYFADRFGRRLPFDAHGLKFPDDAEATTAFHFCGCGRVRPGHPPIVQRTCFEKMIDGGGNLFVAVLAVLEARANPFDRQFATGEQFQRYEVRAQNLVISGMPPANPVPACLAISSRAISPVVEIPWTFSLNSSTFEAQRSASSSVTYPC